jgi:DNA-binding response OmpR family regulator
VTSTVLVVEEERKIREMLRGYLEREGYAVVSTDSGAEAITLAQHADLDLVLLDLRLPDVPGEDVAREIRASSKTPIIMLTAKTTEDDRVHGFELGADDYVTKPFSPRELMLRVRSLLRRMNAATPSDGPTRYGGSELVIDESRREVTVRGSPVELTPTEWALLMALATTPGRVYSRYELVNRVRGYEFDGYERIIDSHVKNLRRKLEADPHSPRIIETVLGAGYRLGLRRDP